MVRFPWAAWERELGQRSPPHLRVVGGSRSEASACVSMTLLGALTHGRRDPRAQLPRGHFFFSFCWFCFLKGRRHSAYASFLEFIYCNNLQRGGGEGERSSTICSLPKCPPLPQLGQVEPRNLHPGLPVGGRAQAKHLLPEILTAPAGPQRPRQRSRTPPGTSRLATGGQPIAAGGVPHSHPTPVSHRSQAERLPSPPSLPRQCLRILPRRRR